MSYHKKWPIHLWFQLFQQRFAKSVIAPLQHPLLPRFIERTGACRPPGASSHDVVSLPASDPWSRYISRYIWGEIGTHEACTCFRSHHRTVQWTNPKNQTNNIRKRSEHRASTKSDPEVCAQGCLHAHSPWRPRGWSIGKGEVTLLQREGRRLVSWHKYMCVCVYLYTIEKERKREKEREMYRFVRFFWCIYKEIYTCINGCTNLPNLALQILTTIMSCVFL